MPSAAHFSDVDQLRAGVVEPEAEVVDRDAGFLGTEGFVRAPGVKCTLAAASETASMR
jgi:hypothetical protein